MAVDDADRIVVAAGLGVTADFDLKNGDEVKLDPAGGMDALVIKFSPSGVPHWARLFGIANSIERAAAVAIAPNGGILVLADLQGAILDPPLDVGDVDDLGDVAILKLDP